MPLNFKAIKKSTHIVAFRLNVQLLCEHVDAVNKRLFTGTRALILRVLRLGYRSRRRRRFLVIRRRRCVGEQLAAFRVDRLFEIEALHLGFGDGTAGG